MAVTTGQTRTKRVVRLRSGGSTARGICERCGSAAPAVFMRKAFENGGQWTPENAVALCPACRDWIGANPTAGHAEGWTVRQFESETFRQVLTWRGWTYLSEIYTYEMRTA